jgi:toxin YhaV
VIVYAWVNDEDTKSAYVSSDDPYRVFRRMLESGRLPDGWDQLLAEAQKESRRMQESLARVTVQEIWCFKFAHSVPQSNLSK